jgi:hypothetical protein
VAKSAECAVGAVAMLAIFPGKVGGFVVTTWPDASWPSCRMCRGQVARCLVGQIGRLWGVLFGPKNGG